MTLVLLVLACLLSLGMFATLDIFSYSLGRTGWRRFLSTILLFYAQIVSTEFVLGLTSLLYNYSLALLNIALSAGLLVILHKKHGRKLFKRYKEGLRTWPATMKAAAKQDRLLLTLYSLAAIFLAWVLFLGVIFPPVDWDGNAYHLSYAADLVQNHNLYDVPTSMIWIPAYPKGGEFIQAWTLLLSHNDTLVDLTQLPFLVLGIVSLYAVARNVGISKRSARYVALLFSFTPSALNQLTTGYVDVMMATTFFAGLALVLQRNYRKLDFLLIGIIFSLLISIKSSGIYMVAILLLPVLFNLYGQHRLALKRYALPALLTASPSVFGLYWYIKNWILYGSPIYPFGFQIAGRTLFHGLNYAQWSSAVGGSMPHDKFIRLWYTWSEHSPDPSYFLYNYDSSYFGLGVIWFIVLVPAMLLSIYLAIAKRRYYLLGAMALLLGLLFVYPIDFSPRYTMFIISAGVIGLGLLFDNLHLVTVRITKTVIIALTIVTLGINFMLWSYSPHTVYDQAVSLRNHQGEHGPSTIFAVDFGQAYVLMHNTIKPGQTIVYTAGNWIYPLWNDTFSNKVMYVDANSEAAWYKQVMAKKPTYVFSTTENKRENHWAADKFSNVIYKDAGYEIYKVR